MNTKLQAMIDTGVLPVINIPDVETALPLVDALRAGGLGAMEITLRSEGSMKALRKIAAERPDFVVGAGTVLSVETCLQAIEAGASYIVSPGFDAEILDCCRKQGVPYIPGCTSATEIQLAAKEGLKTVKFFPAELCGGIAAITLLSGPFPELKFVPTGGITFDNLGQYLRSPKVAACGGSFMASADLIKQRKFEQITENCKRALRISLGFELAHVGINHESEKEAAATVEALCRAFQLDPVPKNSCIFAGTAVEAMKSPFLGTKGHVGFYTNSVSRAVAYFEKLGIAIDRDHIKQDEKGLVAVYLKEEIAGFAFHVVRR